MSERYEQVVVSLECPYCERETGEERELHIARGGFAFYHPDCWLSQKAHWALDSDVDCSRCHTPILRVGVLRGTRTNLQTGEVSHFCARCSQEIGLLR